MIHLNCNVISFLCNFYSQGIWLSYERAQYPPKCEVITNVQTELFFKIKFLIQILQMKFSNHVHIETHHADLLPVIIK